MSLFSDSPRMRKATPKVAPIFLPLDYHDWPDRIFLMFIRDRLLWVHNDDPALTERLNSIIHDTSNATGL